MADDRKQNPRPRGKPGERGRSPRSGRRERDAAKAPEAFGDEAGERIAKRLARAGIASRREAESLIAAGRVRVNGVVLDSPARNVSPADRIELDGQPIPAIERTRLFLFHKPAGVVTTNHDPEGRRTVFDVLPAELPRLMTVGRLDINTEGLLLLTNDGGLARVLELPATGWLRRYRVRVHGKVDETALAGLRDGIAVDGVFYGAVEATLDREQGSNAWLTIGLREGKNREVKNILGALGLDVNRLIRISYGPFQLGELPEGMVHELRGRTLRDQLGERLIEEAGADFDAPIVNPFSNKGENKGETRPASSRPAPRGASPLGPEGEGGLIKSRKRRREEGRESALGRLSTSAPRGDRPGKDGPRRKREDREEVGFQPPRPRGSNVWMAPGARPVAPEKADAEATEKRKEAARPKRAPRARDGEAADPQDRPRKSFGDRPQRAGSERPARPNLDRSRAPGPGREGVGRAGRKPGGDSRPAKRDWKARPPRPGKAERAAAASGEAAPAEYKPRGERLPREKAGGGEYRQRERRSETGEERQRKPFAGKPRGGAGKPFSGPSKPRGGGPGDKPGGGRARGAPKGGPRKGPGGR